MAISQAYEHQECFSASEVQKQYLARLNKDPAVFRLRLTCMYPSLVHLEFGTYILKFPSSLAKVCPRNPSLLTQSTGKAAFICENYRKAICARCAKALPAKSLEGTGAFGGVERARAGV